MSSATRSAAAAGRQARAHAAATMARSAHACTLDALAAFTATPTPLSEKLSLKAGPRAQTGQRARTASSGMSGRSRARDAQVSRASWAAPSSCSRKACITRSLKVFAAARDFSAFATASADKVSKRASPTLPFGVMTVQVYAIAGQSFTAGGAVAGLVLA